VEAGVNGLIDRTMLRALVWLEAWTLRRLKRRWPSEWDWQRGVHRSNGDPERAFLREAHERLVQRGS
jgi:hypothetical protein